MTATNTKQHKNSGNYAEHLLKPCPIHAHHKLKNFFTRGLHNSHCLHRSTIAPWLHKEPTRRWLCFQNILRNVAHQKNKGQKITHKVINFKKFFKNTKSCRCQKENQLSNNFIFYVTTAVGWYILSVNAGNHTILALQKTPMLPWESLVIDILIWQIWIYFSRPVKNWFRRPCSSKKKRHKYKL